MENNSNTRGIRNNNPFNIKRGSSRWLGKIKHDSSTDEVFEQFDTMQHGLRAGFKLLRNYICRYHLYTLEEILKRFAPASENNIKAYLDFFFTQYHLPKDLPLCADGHEIDPLTFGSLCSGLCWYESRYNLTYDEYFRILEYYHILDSFS